MYVYIYVENVVGSDKRYCVKIFVLSTVIEVAEAGYAVLSYAMPC